MNDNAPIWNHLNMHITLNRTDNESPPILSAIDLDRGANGRIRYSILDTELLSIDAETGRLIVLKEVSRCSPFIGHGELFSGWFQSERAKTWSHRDKYLVLEFERVRKPLSVPNVQMVISSPQLDNQSLQNGAFSCSTGKEGAKTT